MYFGRFTVGRLPRCHARPFSCSRKNLLSFCWLLVGQAIAFRTRHDERGPFAVVDAERDPVVVAELKLRAVAVQVALADVVETAVDATLEQTEHALGRVAVRRAAHVFRTGVRHAFVLGELLARFDIARARSSSPQTLSMVDGEHWRSASA